MNVLDSINQFFARLLTTFRQLGQGRIWLLLFGYFFLYWILLFAHFKFLSPLFYSIVTAWTSFVTAYFPLPGLSEGMLQAFTHYPAHFALLPAYFGITKMTVGVVFEGLLVGAIAISFYRINSGDREGRERQVGSLWSRWPHLAAAWLVINGSMIVVGMSLPVVFESFLDGPRREIMFNLGVIPFAFMLIFAVFYNIFPLITIYRQNIFVASWESIKLFFRFPFTCFFFSALIMVIPIIISVILSNYSSVIIRQFDPELVFWLLSFGLLAEMISIFFWMSTSVQLLSNRDV